ncbi:DUF4815 domain-containing protein [Verminephrobacter aporrectodeae subsp. tuberculatae]|uniref:DUF4815 domain-containing protein n=1 Tax=Verminephrobacter aporrectodeae subsp. tuberculatae TaxID=1110392 RepID=A0ABT3KQF9_9BURK|nr:DUF4815 domain-containing protein [Verminephrobacter aporrectodeae]MCW5320551.1 DUF4815 domain-containing protein [Verminephrobacter aporrectodeae subsp. tuberculatae]
MTSYNRFNSAKCYDRHLFQADRTLQSAELNEIQSALIHRVQGIADVLFKDGDLVKDAGIVVNATTGQTLCEAGRVYLAGAVRQIGQATITIDLQGIVYVGVYLNAVDVDYNADPTLLNPAGGTRGYNEPGADRERVDITWGHKDDGQTGTFYPVWVVEDGYVRPKEPPPNLDAVTQALARYDRDSAGGTYVVRGLNVVQGPDLPSGQQVYTISEGAARISGRSMELPASRRVVYSAVPDLLQINDEPHVSTTAGDQRVYFDRQPVVGNAVVRTVIRSTRSIVHGGFSGAADPLPDASVLQVESVTQGATTYNINVDFRVSAGQIDWSPTGAEPNPGSTYNVTYQHVITASISRQRSDGFNVIGALSGTLINVSYTRALRRYDRLAMDVDGNVTWIKGVASEWTPIAPVVPVNYLILATVYQSWDSTRRMVQDAVRVVPMQDLAHFKSLFNRLFEDQAELRLAVDIQGRYSGIKKGLYADPFISNDMRDAGVAQTASIAANALRLPFMVTTYPLAAAITERQAIPHTLRAVLSQSMRTGSMLVNPYHAFDPLPVDLVLKPAVDRWTETKTTWVKPLELNFYTGGNARTETTETLGEASSDLEYLRQIEVQFEAQFGPAERVSSMTFGGVAVTPVALTGGTLVANAQGLLVGKFTVPANLPAGTREVVILGSGASRASALFTGQGTAVAREVQQVVRIWHQRVDPLAQTLMRDAPEQIAGVELWFTARQSSVLVQLREAENGYPTSRVLVEKRLQPADIQTNGNATRVTWSPVLLEAGREYCLVLLCDDTVTAVAVAELGKWDTANDHWVTAQPYQVGVLLSSSNAATWTAHQDRDLAFNLLAADYTATERVIDLGSVDLVGATDLMVQAYVHQPSAASSGVFLLTLLDAGNAVIEAAPGQVVTLPTRYTGRVQVSARLRGAGRLGAVLEPGVQLIAASLQDQGDYVSPQITAGGSVTVRVVLEADLPGGSALSISVQNQSSAGWTSVPYVSSSSGTAGVMELTYELANFTAERLRLRIQITGGHRARPAIYNLRAVVI